ncbi:MAG TPA: hypothetical protein VGN72_20905 [Tepidisphaeraceae bacterium]|jgi:hypothetical protein|nr:hypothetical protein [Tepidisphaeraceae bacterium]
MQNLMNRPTKSSHIILRTLAARPGEQRPTAAERAAVRQAVEEGKDIPERAVDTIVDRLMKELSW